MTQPFGPPVAEEGDELRHITADIDAVCVREDGDYIWVRNSSGGPEEKSLRGFWQVTKKANRGAVA